MHWFITDDCKHILYCFFIKTTKNLNLWKCATHQQITIYYDTRFLISLLYHDEYVLGVEQEKKRQHLLHSLCLWKNTREKKNMSELDMSLGYD